ncbi:hypothetical protein CKALI_02735 [Corynebacterium kalinowskii]|uniref:Uncharacterized protein n=1 Tax=Corynebacterium kalinowskii TaxID=2675216 RepID=A0A6B8VQY6_9CORY|nr:hypothetical protein [Corynebacterium kalinowskii]QGU01435.1 hypothetical protein CKALI_02735 [Corynebacterium kalinowskii]
MTTPEQARQQLDQARQLEKNVTGFNPVWVTYVGLCTAGTIYAMGKFWAPDSLIPMILSLTWAAVSVAMIIVFAVQKTARRGFSRRWLIFMALWGITWAATAIIQPNLDIAMTLSTLYLSLAFAGPAWEVVANR